MSGGVDSSVSLMLLKKAGYEVSGVSLKFDTWKCSRRENVCCSEQSFCLAKKIAASYGVNHRIIDARSLFSKEVIGYFKEELKNNRTPSPCVFCNPKVKFLSLLKYADEIGAEFVATGHYAQVEESEIFSKKQVVLKRGRDKEKDQSYSLSFLTQKELKRIIFPLGELTKREVYEIAKQNKIFNVYKKIKQSQDFCFLDAKDYSRFIDQQLRPSGGPIVDIQGRQIGSHHGLMQYTLGQRKGIGLAGGPFYVVAKKSPNILVVSTHRQDTFKNKAILKPCNLINKPPKEQINILVKARSSEKLHRARLSIENEHLVLHYKKPVSQLVPGQIAVFYKGDICLGAGVING